VALLAERLEAGDSGEKPREVRAGFELVARESTLGRLADR
jgi:hypothetical protein